MYSPHANFQSQQTSAKPVPDATVDDAKELVSSSPTEIPNDQLPLQDVPPSKGNRYIKYAVALLLLGFILFVILDSTIGQMYVRDGVNSFLEWIEDNPAPGVFAFVLVYFAATVLFVPGSILTLGAGFVFANAFGLGPGLLLGSIAVFVGASGGALVSFLLARYLLRDWVGGLTKKYAIFAALDSALAEKGFRIMALLRLSPIIPFTALNYVAGVTAVSFLHYALALFAILPGTILYVFLGASAGSLTDAAMNGSDNATVTIIVVVVGVFFGILAVGLTSYYAKQELHKVTKENQDDAPESNDIESQGGNESRTVGDLEISYDMSTDH